MHCCGKTTDVKAKIVCEVQAKVEPGLSGGGGGGGGLARLVTLKGHEKMLALSSVPI